MFFCSEIGWATWPQWMQTIGSFIFTISLDMWLSHLAAEFPSCFRADLNSWWAPKLAIFNYRTFFSYNFDWCERDLFVYNLSKKSLGLNAHEHYRYPGCYRGMEPCVGPGQCVFQVIVPIGKAIGSLGKEKHRKETAGVGNGLHLPHLPLPRIRHISILKLSFA